MALESLQWAIGLLDTLGYDLQHNGGVWVVSKAGRSIATVNGAGLIRFARGRVDR